MATTNQTRSSEKKEAQKPILLPDMWVTHLQTSTRPTYKPYYFNLRTRQTFYSKEALYRHFREMAAEARERDGGWKKERAEEEKHHMCSRCKEFGHNCMTCPYPMIHMINPSGRKRFRRCSRCHWLGHNVRTCVQAVDEVAKPEKRRSNRIRIPNRKYLA